MARRLLALLLILIAVAVIVPVKAQPAVAYTVDVNRVVRIGEYGLATVEDSFKVHNNSTATLSDMVMGFPRGYERDFRYAAAKDSRGQELTVETDVNSTSPTFWLRASFARPLGFNETYAFNVTMLFTHLVSPQEAGFVYRFASTPILPVAATYANVTVVAPAGTTFKLPPKTNLTDITFEGKPAVRETFRPFHAYTNVTLEATYASVSQFLLELPWMRRDITLAPDGSIYVADTYHFVNRAQPASTIPIRLPKDVSSAMAYDEVGALWTQPQSGPDISMVPRYTGGVKLNESFTFTLRYQLPRGDYTKQLVWWGLYNFTFDYVSNLRFWVVENLTVSLTVPKGLAVESITRAPTSRNAVSLFDDRMTFELRGVSPLHNTTFAMVYKYPPFWAALTPLAWVAILEAAVVSVLLVNRLRKPPGLEVPVPTERIRSFVELYDGKMALKLELGRMDEDLARGALSKHEFRRRKKIIDVRLDELNRALSAVKPDLRAVHPRYDEMIKKLEKAEAEIDATRVSEAQVRAQYRTGKVTKETYETLIADLRRRIDRATETMEATIITLREEAR